MSSEIVKTKTDYIVFERAMINELLGSKAAAESPWLYKIKRAKHHGRLCWHIPRIQVEWRLEILTSQLASARKRIALIEKNVRRAK